MEAFGLREAFGFDVTTLVVLAAGLAALAAAFFLAGTFGTTTSATGASKMLVMVAKATWMAENSSSEMITGM